MRQLTAGLCFAVCAAAGLDACGEGPHRYEAVNKAAAALTLDSIGATSACLNRTGASFSGWTYCQILVTSPDAVTKVNAQVGAHGYTLVAHNTQLSQSVWKHGAGESALTVTVDPVVAGGTYADLNGKTHHVGAESALVQVQLGE